MWGVQAFASGWHSQAFILTQKRCSGAEDQKVITSRLGRDRMFFLHGGLGCSSFCPATSSSQAAVHSRFQKRRELNTLASASIGRTLVKDSESRTSLKNELMAQIDSTKTVQEKYGVLIKKLAAFSPVVEPLKNPESVYGTYDLLQASEAVLYNGSKVTLGRLNFNMLQPAALGVRIDNVIYEIGVLNGKDIFNITTFFTIQEPGLPELKGASVAEGAFTVSSPTGIESTFIGLRMRPRVAPGDMELWRSTFRENPSLDEEGCVYVPVPKPYTFRLDFIYVDENLTILQGASGAFKILAPIKSGTQAAI